MDFPILSWQFRLAVEIGADGHVGYRAFDAQTDDEYFLARVQDATGAFVGEVHAACESVLKDIAANCFDEEIFKSDQTKRTIAHIEEKYGAKPEFLWEKLPEYAAFRTGKNAWFALVASVPSCKLIPGAEGMCEIVNLKNTPEEVARLVEEGRVFPAYHMNKKRWLSLILDGTTPDDELFALINVSFSLTS